MQDTLSVALFLSMAAAVNQGERMIPRSAKDKEYFPQDWFQSQAARVPGVSIDPQGRNSYPDFWVSRDDLTEGYEVKSLAFAQGRPARTDIDFNSTIPSGMKAGRPVFLLFLLYTDSGANPRPVHSLVVAHADLINCDHELADFHINSSIRQFGSFGDGFIRDRKMYVLPHPLTIYPDGIGRLSLIVPATWGIAATGLRKVHELQREVAQTRLTGYEINLWGGEATSERQPSPRAGETLPFDVFEPD
ncbi:MAG: hypothetical protein WEB00_04525 [Dehalococcoidia bacterium]